MATREDFRESRDLRTRRVERLNTASVRHVIEPDVDVVGDFTAAQIIPDDLLSTAGLDLDLTPEQKATLAREELASMMRLGIAFEAILMAGFAFRLAIAPGVTDPRFTYALHEIGEETRHSRLFARVVEQLQPAQRHPIDGKVSRRIRGRLLPMILRRPAMLDALVLGGEEIPDLLQKLVSEHPDADDYLRRVSLYHRQEEARHLAYARTTVAEHYRSTVATGRRTAGRAAADRLHVRHDGSAVGLSHDRPARLEDVAGRAQESAAAGVAAAGGAVRAERSHGQRGVRARRGAAVWRRLCAVDRNGLTPRTLRHAIPRGRSCSRARRPRVSGCPRK